MGGFCTPSYTSLPDVDETVTGTEIPEWVAAAGRTLFERSAQVADSPYPTYTGERTATFDGDRLTADERAGMNILREGAEDFIPFINRASSIANTLGRGYDSFSREELLGDPYAGATRESLIGDFQTLSADELLGGYTGASREELLGDYQGASREELLGDFQGATREELLGDQFSLESAQPFLDIYQGAQDAAVREIEEQSIRAQNRARLGAGTSGAFGSRLGILEGTAAGEASEAAGDLRARAAREGLGFAADRFDTERQARFAAEDTLSSQAERDRAARFGAEDVMRGQFAEDRAARFGAEDVMRGQFMEDRAGRFSAEDMRRSQAEADRGARFGAEDVMYDRFGDQRAARFGAEEALRTGFETDEAARIAQMESYRSMAPLISDLQQQAAAGLISSGEAQRILDQRALDLAYADYMDQRMYDMDMVNFALGALSGTPYNVLNRSLGLGVDFAANPSIYGQSISALGQLASAYGYANR